MCKFLKLHKCVFIENTTFVKRRQTGEKLIIQNYQHTVNTFLAFKFEIVL